MPLSEQEQRLLEEMERGLYQNDADFVATVGQHRGKPNYTIVVGGILLGLLGIGILLTGVVVHQPVVGVLGFVLMFAGVMVAITPPRRSVEASKPSAARKTAKASSFMDNLGDRWEKRQDERGH